MSEPLFEFEISGSELRRAAEWLDRLAFARVQRGAENLSGVLVRADSAALQVTFSASDTATYGVAICEGKIRTAGQAIVSARLLSLIAKTCSRDEVIRFEREGSEVKASAGSSASWELPTMPSDYWPLYKMRGELWAEVDGDAFAKAVTRVLPAVDREKIEPTYGGLAIRVDPDRVSVVATDIYRVAVAYVPAETFVSGGQVIVPSEDFVKALSGRDGSHVVGLSTMGEAHEHGCILSGAGFRARTRLIDTKYPMWDKAVPSEGGKFTFEHSSITLDVKEAKTALARVKFLAADDAPVRVSIGDEDVTFAVAEEDGGRARGSAACSANVTEGHHDYVVFRSGYLDDVLNGIAAPYVELGFSASHTMPVVAYPLDETGERLTDYVHVVRPINLDRRRR